MLPGARHVRHESLFLYIPGWFVPAAWDFWHNENVQCAMNLSKNKITFAFPKVLVPLCTRVTCPRRLENLRTLCTCKVIIRMQSFVERFPMAKIYHFFLPTTAAVSRNLLKTMSDLFFCQAQLYINIYPSHGYTALVADEICKTYQAILACWSSLGTYRCM